MIDVFENYIFFDSLLYKIVAPNNGAKSTFSLKNILTNKYIRHKNGKIIESYPDKTDTSFNYDSSFFMMSENDNVYFRCSNDKFIKYYISKKNDSFIIDKNNPYLFIIAKNIDLDKVICVNGDLYLSCKPNNNEKGCRSFRLINSDSYLRHKNGRIINSNTDRNDIFFNDDSSFFCLTNGGATVLFCSNKELNDCFVSKNLNNDYFISNKGIYAFFEILNNKQYIDTISHQIKYHCRLFFENYVRNIIQKQNIVLQKFRHSFLANKAILREIERQKFEKLENCIHFDLSVSNKPCISVIVPVYNMEKYIGECLTSILSQTIKNIEVIAIDDGSADNSFNILEQYAKNDKRISIYKQSNQGVGNTRNFGIQVANGEYICFIDPDDIYPCDDILENLYLCVKNFDVDIAGGEFSTFSNENNLFSQRFGIGYEGYKFNVSGLINYADYQFDYGFHRFIYSLNLLRENDIFFPNYKRFQDPPFFVQAMHTAKRFFAINAITYCYRVDHKKINWNEDKINDFIQGMYDVVNFAKTNSYLKLELFSFYHLCDHYKEIKNFCTADNKYNLKCLIDCFNIDHIKENFNSIMFDNLATKMYHELSIM